MEDNVEEKNDLFTEYEGLAVELLQGGETLSALEDIEYFQRNIARAMGLNQIPLVKKLEKQVELLKISAEDPHKDFDEAMKVIE